MKISAVLPYKSVSNFVNFSPKITKNNYYMNCDTVSFGNIKEKPMDEKLKEILDDYMALPQVKAIGIGGSSAANTGDSTSDIDIYMFVEGEVSLEDRERLAQKYSSNYEVGGDYFGAGDEYFADALGRELDIMYFDKNWFEDGVDRVWLKHQPSNGYTTCFLYTLDKLKTVDDKDNYISRLKNTINTPYPKELKDNITKRNMMLIKDKPFSSYTEQIEKSLKRGDINSTNHRIAAYLESYFDILFAQNELLHPGEKRLVQFAKNNCTRLPEDFEENIVRLLNQPNPDTIDVLDDMTEKLRAIIE